MNALDSVATVINMYVFYLQSYDREDVYLLPRCVLAYSNCELSKQLVTTIIFRDQFVLIMCF